MAVVNANLDQFPATFLAYLPDNIHVYLAFELEALGVAASGYTHYSARTIVEVLRHASALHQHGDSSFKLDNIHTPYLARLFGLMNPGFAAMFERREARALRRELGAAA